TTTFTPFRCIRPGAKILPGAATKARSSSTSLPGICPAIRSSDHQAENRASKAGNVDDQMIGSKAMKRTKPRHPHRLRDGDQIPTGPVTLREIMSDPKFARGVADARAGRGYPPPYDTWEDRNWAYERGRQWAQIAPRGLPLKINGKLNPQALRYGADLL